MTKTNQYQTIKYRYFDNHKKDLIVILPGAGLEEGSHQPLIELLSQIANVPMIDDGYLGLTHTEVCNLNLYTSSIFCHNLKTILARYNYSKIYILGSSVGCIHAIKFMHDNPQLNCKVLLASPPILSRINAGIILILLNLALIFSPVYTLSLFIKIFKLFPQLRGISEIMKKTISKTGHKPYLWCLKEIAEFSCKQLNLIHKIGKRDIVILFGKNDPTYNFCHNSIKKMTEKRGFISGSHSLFTQSPDEIYRIIKSVLNELPSSKTARNHLSF